MTTHKADEVYTVSSTGSSAEDPQSVGSLLSRLGEDVGGLVSTEVQLAKTEIGESVDSAKTGIASLIVGAAVLLVGLVVLLNGVSRTLAVMTELQAWVAFLIVGGVVTLIGAIMLFTAKSKLSADSLALSRTSASVNKDTQVVKEKMS